MVREPATVMIRIPETTAARLDSILPFITRETVGGRRRTRQSLLTVAVTIGIEIFEQALADEGIGTEDDE